MCSSAASTRFAPAREGISAKTAVRLGLAFDIDPQFWLNLQAQYDIEVIQRDHGDALADEVTALG